MNDERHARTGTDRAPGGRTAAASALLVLLLGTAACTELYSFCREFLEDLLVQYGATPDYLSSALVITFHADTPPEVIDAVVALCGGTITAQYPVHYVTLGFDDADAARRAAECYDFESDVSVCLPETYVSLAGPLGRAGGTRPRRA